MRKHLPASVVVIAMGLATLRTVQSLDYWVGDLGALLWVCACFFFPFIAGIAWGPGGRGLPGRIVGALMGAGIASLPHLFFDATPGMDPWLLPWLWLVFTPLGAAQGAIAMPVGASARKRRRAAA